MPSVVIVVTVYGDVTTLDKRLLIFDSLSGTSVDGGSGRAVLAAVGVVCTSIVVKTVAFCTLG